MKIHYSKRVLSTHFSLIQINRLKYHEKMASTNRLYIVKSQNSVFKYGIET